MLLRSFKTTWHKIPIKFCYESQYVILHFMDTGISWGPLSNNSSKQCTTAKVKIYERKNKTEPGLKNNWREKGR